MHLSIASGQGNFLNPNSPDTPAANAQNPLIPAAGQDPESTNKLTAEQVQTELEQFQKLEGQEELKKKVVPLLEATIANLNLENTFREKAKTYQADPQVTAQETASFQQEIERGFPTVDEKLKPIPLPQNPTLNDIQRNLSEVSKWLKAVTQDEEVYPPLPPNPTLEDIQRRLTELNTRLSTRLEVVTQGRVNTEKELEELQIELARRKTRETEVPVRLSAIDKRLQELKDLLQQPAPDGEEAAFTKAKRVALNAEQQKLQEERNALKLELPFYSARAENRRLKQELLEKKKEYLKKLETEFKARRDDLEKSKSVLKAAEAQKTVKQTSAALKPLAEEVAELTELMRSQEGPQETHRQLEAELTVAEQTLEDLTDNSKSTRETLQDELRPRTLAQLLDYQRSQIPPVFTYEERELKHRSQLIEIVGLKVKYEEAAKSLNSEDNLQEELDRLLAEVSPDSGADDPLRAEAKVLLTEKKAALKSLIAEYEALRKTLNSLSETEHKIVTTVHEYEGYLNEKSMWVPVAEVIQIRDFTHLENGFKPLVEPANWLLLGRTMKTEVYNSPVWSGVIVLLLLLYLPMQTRLKRRLFQLSDEFSENFLAPFALTKKAFFITMLLPLWIPVLLWLVGYRLQRVLPSTEDPAANPAFVPAFGQALIAVAFVVCVLRLTRYLVKSNGLGEVHFRWPKQKLSKVRLNLHWFTLCVVPLVFLIAMIYEAGTSEERRSLGRILMVGLMLSTSWFFYRVLAPVRSKDERSSAPQLTLWQKITTYGPCCIPLLFALLSISGYTYTAAILMWRLILSSGILLVLVMLNEMGYRWVYIARGKLALEQARQRQEARDAQEAAKAEGETSEAPRAFDPKSAGVDLSSINTQTRQLLSTSFHLAIFFSMWLLWSSTIPILSQPVFGKGEIVSKVTQLEGSEESTTSDDSTDKARDEAAAKDESFASAPSQSAASDDGVTIGDLLLVVLVPIITVIASKNLPGLLEITILQNLPLDTGIRYAAGSIARYIVIAIGIGVTFSLLGIGMTQISIVLGGLAVGLGFGLQEMFANFFSGIILLFEQPLRVGDIVTIGDITGSVTRIRIRATTITDWDRKEFIIPNKELISGKFNNWTLSDTINRIVILVGVAYGSDTERARELILKVCADHPEVLEDPPPTAIFDAFGGSSLNITMRCFLPKLDNRLQTIHELHTAIDREFKKAGIEIAFPQMDLHLRSIDRIKNPIPLSQEVPETGGMYREAD